MRMKYCTNWKKLRDGHYKCLDCKKLVRISNLSKIESYTSTCSTEKKLVMEEPEPTSFQRIKTFIVAATKHAASGFPMCSDDEVKERYEICETCHYFKEKKGHKYCKSLGCGCNISRASNKYLNKLAWKTESCPQGKWGTIE